MENRLDTLNTLNTIERAASISGAKGDRKGPHRPTSSAPARTMTTEESGAKPPRSHCTGGGGVDEGRGPLRSPFARFLSILSPSILLLFAILALSLTLLAFPLAVSAHPLAGSGHIYGQLLNGSRHNAPVAGQSVILQMAQGGHASDLSTISTDAQGRFSFNNLSTDKTINYAVYTLYQRAQYYTDLIDLSSKPVDQVNLTVYDATSSTSNLAIAQANVLIDKADAQHGLVTITESYFVENLGLTTYVGSLQAKGQMPNALRFSLPGGARQLSLKGGFDGYNIVQVNAGFATDAAVPPGLSQFAFSFQVPYSASHYDFSYTVVYPTVDLAVLLPLNYHASSATLTPKGAVTVSGQTYQELSAQKMLAGAQVQVELDGLPATVPDAPVTSSNVNPAWLIYAGLAMLVIVAITLYFAMRARRARSAALSRQKDRQKAPGKASPTLRNAGSSGERGHSTIEKDIQETLLADLLALDKAYEAGTIKKAEYDEQRATVRAQLRAVMEREVVAQKQPAAKSRKTARTAARSGRKA